MGGIYRGNVVSLISCMWQASIVLNNKVSYFGNCIAVLDPTLITENPKY